MEKAYVNTVRLMLEVAPHVFVGSAFALKGGTALNLFVEEMPRLSVDLDVVYRDHATGRTEALREIGSLLNDARSRLAEIGIEADLRQTQDGNETKLFAYRDGVEVKIEVNHVFRGTLMPVEARRLVQAARDQFTVDLSLPVLAVPELHGSKLVAALDRQHPRDFFDVRGMLERPRLSAETIECFIGYLAGHNRPMHEVLFSRDQDFSAVYENEFRGMTIEEVSLEHLTATRDRLRRELAASLTELHRRFLLSLAKAEPDWSLLPFQHLSEMPAIRWKLQNLERLKRSNPGKFRQQAEDLEKRF